MTATLLLGGRILSPASRDATALAHESGIVTWVGQDAPGPTLNPGADVVELDGDWIAPAFVECLPDGIAPDDAADSGTVLASTPAPLADSETTEDALTAVVLDGRKVLVGADRAETVLAALVGAARRRAGRGVGGTAGRPGVAASAPVLLGVPEVDDRTLEGLAAFGVVALLRPLVDDLGGVDLVRLASSGLVLAASAREVTAGRPAGELPAPLLRPWAAARALAQVPGGRGLSPRAAFTALTSGSRRAAGQRDPMMGTVVPSAPATFARWRVGELVSTAADDAVQRWSTDPRSGVPPMPDLSGPVPECVGLTVDGR